MTIEELQDKIYNTYGLVLKKDDPAWLMILIYNDLLKEVNKSIDDLQNMPKISQSNESILTALSDLQLKTSDLFDKAENITGKVTTENNAFINGITEQINGIKTVIKSSVDDATNGITVDTKKIEQLIENKLLELDLGKIDLFINTINTEISKARRRMNKSLIHLRNRNTGIQTSVGELNTSIKQLNSKAKEINNATDNLNNKIASLGWGRFFAGLAIGATAAGSIMYVNSHTVYNMMFEKQEQERLEELKLETQMLFDESTSLDKKYAEKADVIKILLKYGIDIYDNEGKRYVRTKTIFGKKGIIYNPSNGYSFIQIDTY